MAASDTSEAEIADSPFSRLSAELIKHNYRDLGCDDWTRPRFWRLCAKLGRTKIEMAALMRLPNITLECRLRDGFTNQDGLILTLLEREIDQIKMGAPPTRGLFFMAELKQTAA